MRNCGFLEISGRMRVWFYDSSYPLPDKQSVCLLVNDRKFPAENSVFLSHQTSQQ